jgi:hypothetical protein
MEYFYKYGTADTVTQEVFNFPARRQTAVKCKMALTSQQRNYLKSRSVFVFALYINLKL